MNLFQPPPVTRYDINFTLGGIPIRIHPLFWLIALLFGASTRDLVSLLIWIITVFISILVHELGHALVMNTYGQESYIVLHLAGGLTVPESMRWGNGRAYVSLSRKQKIFISLAGPFAGFLLAALIMLGVVVSGGSITMTATSGAIPIPTVLMPLWGEVARSFVMTFLWVNVFWGLINLMPVYPLDGGNVVRYLMVIIDPLNGIRKSLWISVIAGAIIAVLGLYFTSSMYIAFLFSLLAIQSYQTLKGNPYNNY